MRYRMFIKHTEDYRNKKVPAGLYEAMGEFIQAGFKSGALIDTSGLLPTAAGKRVRLRGGAYDALPRQHVEPRVREVRIDRQRG